MNKFGVPIYHSLPITSNMYSMDKFLRLQVQLARKNNFLHTDLFYENRIYK